MNESELKNKPDNWERSLVENLALSSLREQRRTRSWGIFFKILIFLYLFIVLFVALGWIEEGIWPMVIAGSRISSDCISISVCRCRNGFIFVCCHDVRYQLRQIA